MDTRSKVSNTPNPNSPMPKPTNMPPTKKMENMTVDEKLNMLASIQKLESVPDDITTINEKYERWTAEGYQAYLSSRNDLIQLKVTFNTKRRSPINQLRRLRLLKFR